MNGERYCAGVVEGTGERCRKPPMVGKDVCFYHDTDTTERRCVATVRAGHQCTKPALKNQRTCEMHGGRISLAQARAQLTNLRPTAIRALYKALECGEWPVVVQAARLILDRTGMGPQATLTIDDKAQDLTLLSNDELEERARRVYLALQQAKQHEHDDANQDPPTIDGETLEPGDEGPVH